MDLRYLTANANTAQRMREHIRRQGCTMQGYLLWQEQEDQLIAQLYPDYKRITKALPHRTFSACKCRAHNLQVAKKIRMWKASEISLLRRVYSKGTKAELLLAFPDRNWRSISYAALRHKIMRARRPYKLTGVDILDQIRARCWELHLTMEDLDRMVRGSGYFTQKIWYGDKVPMNYNLIARAVKKLFGDLKIEWK